ncbi:MAG: hypothetical protein KatS3mg002_0136 [Candidatus Woesearchaeota archaeon]|nr:MAG: hypothetical protein KatS3mg002_0136 [Candidatus Woesearchaeota archaeon]
MSKIFIPGTAGDYDSVYEGRSSGGIIIDGELTIVIDPGIGFIVKSGLKKVDIILMSNEELLYSNDAKAIIKKFNAKMLDNNNESIKKIQNSFKIITPKYILGYINNPKLTKGFAEEFKDTNIMVFRCETTTIEEIINLIDYINPELAILTGFKKGTDGIEFSRHLKSELKKYRKEHLKTQIIPAKEQMTINPDSYNIKLKQKNLKGFI